MYQTADWNDESGFIRITEQRDIDTILTALSTAKQTSLSWYSAANEAPEQSKYLTISIYTDEERTQKTFHLYGGQTIYAGYIGIYRVGILQYEEILQFYSDYVK